MKRIVHYINQFYAGIGGEEKADQTPFSGEKIMGPGMGLAKEFGDRAHIVRTVVCGDGYYGEHTEAARTRCLELIEATTTYSSPGPPSTPDGTASPAATLQPLRRGRASPP